MCLLLTHSLTHPLHKRPQRNYHTQDPGEAGGSLAVHVSIPQVGSPVIFLICQVEKMGFRENAAGQRTYLTQTCKLLINR